MKRHTGNGKKYRKPKQREVSDILADAFSAGSWFQISKCLVRICEGKLDEGLILGYLINHAKVRGLHTKWFYCLARDMVFELDLTMAAQTRLIRNLVGRGFLRAKREKGRIPARRLMKFNWRRIKEALLEAEDRQKQKIVERQLDDAEREERAQWNVTDSDAD